VLTFASTVIDVAGFDYVLDSGSGHTPSGAEDSAIAGGQTNLISNQNAFIGAGEGNTVSGSVSFAGAGSNNTVSGHEGFVGAGFGNEVSGEGSFIGAGGVLDASNPNNQVFGEDSFIGAGDKNSASNHESFVGAGVSNSVSGVEGFVGAGFGNLVSGQGSFIGGGGVAGDGTPNNEITGADSFIGDGTQNAIQTSDAFVGGGSLNDISGNATYAVISGGFGNGARNAYASVGGGEDNTISGQVGTIPGGEGNTVQGFRGFAAGYHAEALHAGTFVWSDYVAGSKTVSDTVKNEFFVRASGGTAIYSNEALSSGVKLVAGGGSWASVSDRNAKTDIVPLDDASILAKVAALPVSTWQYKSERGVRHVGPMAQDFHAAFGVGEDDRHITSIDEDGVRARGGQGSLS
jgi:hypothetical protein